MHQIWLARRAAFEIAWKRLTVFNPKHQDTIRLENEPLDQRRAERVIANSQMVKNEIVDTYNYRPDRIDVIRNGVPLAHFRFDPAGASDGGAQPLRRTNRPCCLLARAGNAKVCASRSRLGNVDSQKISPARRRPRTNRTTPPDLCAISRRGRRSSRPYAAADLFILPTIYDPFSNACLEALAVRPAGHHYARQRL